MKRTISKLFLKLALTIRRDPGLLLTIFASLLIVILLSDLLQNVMDETGDNTYHLVAEAQVAQAMKDGRNPFGPLSINFGTPFLRFYQPLFYLLSGAIILFTGLAPYQVHNLLILLFFAASPFGLRFAIRSIGLPKFCSGMASLLSLISVAGFGRSFESTFSTGVVCQLPGDLFFTLFLGLFARLLTTKKGPFVTAFMFALVFTTHVMMAVYAVFVGVLLFFSKSWPIKTTWKPISVFALMGTLLIAFWLVPFVEHQHRFRTIPEWVVSPGKSFYHYGLEEKQATALLFSGRFLDDARASHNSKKRKGYDKLIDKINMRNTPKTRPPILTILTLMGLGIALIRFRRMPYRFMASGFIFSFFLTMGPDDITWLKILPFSSRVQFFRTVYLLEFFSFALSAVTIDSTLKTILRFSGPVGTGRHAMGKLLMAALTLGTIITTTVFASTLAQSNFNPKKMVNFKRSAKILGPAKNHFPLRSIVHFSPAQHKNRHHASFLGHLNFQTTCSHWKGIGPSISPFLCGSSHRPGTELQLTRRIGIGLYLVGKEWAGKLHPKKRDVLSRMLRLKKGHGRYLYLDKGAGFLWDGGRSALTVVSNEDWYYVQKAWALKMKKADSVLPVTPVKFTRGDNLDDELLAAVDSIFVIDPSQLSTTDLKKISNFQAQNKKVLSTSKLENTETKPISPDDKPLFDTHTYPVGESEQSVIEQLEARAGGPYVYKVRNPSPNIFVLPEFAVPGWTATVNGKPVSVVAAAHEMVGVPVPAGLQTIRIWWETPRTHLLYFIVSAIAILALLIAAITAAVRKAGR